MNRFERCRRCGTVVLHVDRDVLGDQPCLLLLDPALLTPAGVVAAVLAGRGPWRHGVEAGRHAVGTAHPAARSRRLGGEDGLAASHACGLPLGGRPFSSLARTDRLPDEAPF